MKIIEDIGLCVGELFDKIRKLESENAFLRGQLHAHKPSKHQMIYKNNKMWMCTACDWWRQDDGSYDAGDRCQVCRSTITWIWTDDMLKGSYETSYE